MPSGCATRRERSARGSTPAVIGYVLAAGYRDPGRLHYRVLRAGPVASLPEWLQDALTNPPDLPRERGGAAGPGSGHSACDDDLPAPRMSTARAEAYVRAVVDGESRAVTGATIGTRHTTLLRAARRLGQRVGSGFLTAADARSGLVGAACGYIGVAGYTARQVERDVADSLAYGVARPRDIDDVPDRPSGRAPDSHR